MEKSQEETHDSRHCKIRHHREGTSEKSQEETLWGGTQQQALQNKMWQRGGIGKVSKGDIAGRKATGGMVK